MIENYNEIRSQILSYYVKAQPSNDATDWKIMKMNFSDNSDMNFHISFNLIQTNYICLLADSNPSAPSDDASWRVGARVIM